MSAADPTGDDLIFEDEYQRARRRRMRTAGLTAKPAPSKAGGALVHDRDARAGVTRKDVLYECPGPRAFEERPRATLTRSSDVTPSEVMELREGAEVRGRQKPSCWGEAVAFLKRELAAGPTPARVIYERGARIGLSERTIDRAKDGANIGSKRLKTGQGMQWFWCLPGIEPSSLDQ
jgi:hypothetical protein